MTLRERLIDALEQKSRLFVWDGVVDTILAEIEAAGYDMIEHIPMADPDAPVLHPFTVTPDGDSYFIQFPDLPGCMTQAETLYEIGPMAQDAYVNWTEAARDGGFAIPEPKP